MKVRSDFDTVEEWDAYNVRFFDDIEFALGEEKHSYRMTIEQLKLYMMRPADQIMANPRQFATDIRHFAEKLDDRLAKVQEQLTRLMVEENAEWYKYGG